MSTYKDLQNNPRLKGNYETRIKIIRLIREFFWNNNFIETDTPIAVHYPGQEPYLSPVPVLFNHPDGKKAEFYLQTSPEFAMKKLLSTGMNKIFQICKCFRDYEEWGGLHNTEFSMIEWYRSPGELINIMDDCENLFKFVGKQLGVSEVKYNDQKIDIILQWDRVSMKTLWQKYIGVDLDKYLEVDSLRKLLIKKDYTTRDDDNYEDLFFKIFLNEIEPKLGLDKPIFVYDYPTQMCSLSNLCEHDKRYAQRFELYVGGMELANAFGELIDSTEQLKRLKEDKEIRKKMDREIYDIDLDFIKALDNIKKPTAGIALGVDRMVMLFTGTSNINEVIFQGVGEQN